MNSVSRNGFCLFWSFAEFNKQTKIEDADWYALHCIALSVQFHNMPTEFIANHLLLVHSATCSIQLTKTIFPEKMLNYTQSRFTAFFCIQMWIYALNLKTKTEISYYSNSGKCQLNGAWFRFWCHAFSEFDTAQTKQNGVIRQSSFTFSWEFIDCSLYMYSAQAHWTLKIANCK